MRCHTLVYNSKLGGQARETNPDSGLKNRMVNKHGGIMLPSHTVKLLLTWKKKSNLSIDIILDLVLYIQFLGSNTKSVKPLLCYVLVNPK